MNISLNPERDLEIYSRHCSGETMTSIAGDYNLTRERVRQICFEQNALNRRKFVNSVTYEKPRDSELYRWIIIRSYPKFYDPTIRVRAYNAIKNAWNKCHNSATNPTVEYLISFDNASLLQLKGVGAATATFLIHVRDAILEDRAKRDEKRVSDTGRITYLGADGNVYLRSSSSMEIALARLYAYESSGLGPAQVKDYRRELEKRENLGVHLAPLQIQELHGILGNEGLYVEFRWTPKFNGWMLWKNRNPGMETESYMIEWRAWPYEPTPEAMQETAWMEPAGEKDGGMNEHGGQSKSFI